MTYQLSADVARLIDAKMASGKYASADELLLDALQSLGDVDEESAAIRAGLESLDRGDKGTPLGEAFSNLRKRHNVDGKGSL